MHACLMQMMVVRWPNLQHLVYPLLLHAAECGVSLHSGKHAHWGLRAHDGAHTAQDASGSCDPITCEDPTAATRPGHAASWHMPLPARLSARRKGLALGQSQFISSNYLSDSLTRKLRHHCCVSCPTHVTRAPCAPLPAPPPIAERRTHHPGAVLCREALNGRPEVFLHGVVERQSGAACAGADKAGKRSLRRKASSHACRHSQDSTATSAGLGIRPACAAGSGRAAPVPLHPVQSSHVLRRPILAATTRCNQRYAGHH